MKHFLSNLILAGSILSLFTACGPKGQSNDDSPKIQAHGGIDSSGGDLVKSSDEQFEIALDNSLDNVRTAYWRLSEILIERSANCEQCEIGLIPVADERFGGGVVWLNVEIDEPPIRFKDLLSVENRKKVQETINKIKIEVNESACSSNEGHRDAAASSNGEICLNRVAIKKLAPESLELNLTALLAHEVGHVLGLNELQAEAIQRSLRSFPSIALRFSNGASKIEAEYENRLQQLLAISEVLKNWYLDPKIDRTHELCKYDMMKLSSRVQPTYDSNAYIPVLYDQEKSVGVVNQLMDVEKPAYKIWDYCNLLSTNDKTQIRDAKNALLKNIKSVVMNVLQVRKQLADLSDEVSKGLYLTGSKHVSSWIAEFSQYQIELLMNGKAIGQKEINGVKCKLKLESELHEFQIYKDVKIKYPIKANPELEAYIQISGWPIITHGEGVKNFVVDVQVFSPKIKHSWWLSLKSDKDIISVFDHTYTFLTSGIKESFNFSGDFVYQKDSYNLDAIVKNIELSCSAQ